MAQFHAALDAISDAHERAENFRRFMEAAYCSRALTTAPNARRTQQLEARFSAVAQAYGKERNALVRMSQLLCRLAATVALYQGDFLTEAYVGMRSSACHGAERRIDTLYDTAMQILRGLLRPRHVALLLSTGQPISLHLAHAGAGTQVLAMAAHLASMGVDPRRALYAELIERDQLTYQIAFLQLSIRGIPALCICADALEQREFDRACTTAAAREALPLTTRDVKDAPAPRDFHQSSPREDASLAERAVPHGTLPAKVRTPPSHTPVLPARPKP